MTYIYYASISEENHKNLMEKFLFRFPIDFQKKITGFQRWQDAQLSLLGRILLCKAAVNFNKDYKKYLDIKYNKFKKPFIEDDDVYFNISHSGEMVICAVTNVCDIGIDIELVRDVDIEDFQPQMTNNEWLKISTSFNKLDSFYNYWTQKEAVIKCCGKGLFVTLKSFEIAQNIAIIDDEKFFIKEIMIDDKYKCHVATSELINNECMEISELNSSNYHTY
ncbi:4'-phosphopantetheinyl transferase superfamily protein [Flavobacterium sp. W22_SRS_FK3]|uniref:4'-phosphopantetheinyl transferase family protein n=1 Tax=Flavobacterium sp. W22_SRS_FK3 TaxID=3240275 RepID=UPI003F923EE0